ncbi:MAG TPA: alpha/beta hydrolase [Coriobacteriia bacterium]|nr:alpha/beta hydrolase [Coriobacteriia bacterium]
MTQDANRGRRTAGITLMVGVLLLCASGCSNQGGGAVDPSSSRSASQSAGAPAQREYRDVSYSDTSSRNQLNLYLPTTGEGPFPVIVYIHPGGYVIGDKDLEIPELREAARARGYAVASVGYRLVDEAGFPAQIQDVKAGIRWLRANAQEYALDESRVAVWGVSAGGHLAALAATSDGVAQFENEALGNPEQSSSVQAAVDWFGPANFVTLARYLDAQRRQTGLPRLQLDPITRQITASPNLAKAANPASHADPTDPPILIQHGDRDDVVPLSQSQELAAEMKRKMGAEKVTFRVERGEGHATAFFVSTENIERILDWLDEALGR